MADIDDSLLKQHMRVDNDLDDNLISSYREAAVKYIINAVGGSDSDEFYKDNPEFNLAVRMLSDQYYRDRTATTVNKATEVAYGVQSIILQLKPAYIIWRQEQNAHSTNR